MRDKSAEISISAIIKIVLGILVLVLIIWLIWGGDLWSLVKQLPEYGGPEDRDRNITPDNLTDFQCPIRIAKLSTVENRFTYLVSRAHSLHMYEGPGIGRDSGLTVNVEYKDKYVIYFDKLGPFNIDVGVVENNKLSIYSDYITNYHAKGEDYATLRENVRLDDLKRLDGSFLVDVRTFCKTESQFEDLDKKSQCQNAKLTCEMLNGVCREKLTQSEIYEINKELDPEDKFRDVVDKCEETEISFGDANCGSEKTCCVKQVDSELSSEGIVIDGFSFVPVENKMEALESGVPIPLLDKSRLDVDRGKQGWIFFSSKYNGETFDDGESPVVCYLIMTNKEVKHRGHFSSSFVPWIPTEGDRNLELLIWVPWEGKKRAFKRIKVLPKQGGELYVDNEEFGASANIADSGDVFYVTLDKPLRFIYEDVEERLIKKYRIRKISGDRISIDGFYNDDWIEFDCNWWGGWTSISVSDVKKKLSDTLEYCEF